MTTVTFRRAKHVVLLVVITCAAVGALTAQPVLRAQDATPARAGDVMLTAYADMVFPSAIRFFLELTAAPDTIAAVTLTVHQDSGLQASVPIDLQQNLIGNQAGVMVIVYQWDLAEPPVPVPFEPVSFRWDVVFTDDTQAFAADAVLYAPPVSGSWQTTGAPPVVLHWYAPRLAGRTLRDELLIVQRLLEQQLGAPPPMTFVIYEPGTTLCREIQDEASGAVRTVVISGHDAAEYPCSRGLVELAYATAGLQFVQRTTTGGYTGLQSQLIRELVRRSYTDQWGGLRVPAWFVSGLADYYRMRPDVLGLETVRQAARLERLLGLDILIQGLPETASLQEQTLWHAQSYLMVLYLADHFDAQAPFEFARQLALEDDFASALEEYTGEDLTAFWNGWNRWIFSASAEEAAAWTPYYPVTPTPTATASATPIPPTRTPTFTRTPTRTPTATLTPSSTPTVTPSATSTPTATPTLTPSLTRTAAPTTAPSPTGEGATPTAS